MKALSAFFLICSCLFFSCENEPASTNKDSEETSSDSKATVRESDPLTIEIKSLLKNSPNCQSEEALCARIKILYPFASGSQQPLIDSINAMVTQSIIQNLDYAIDENDQPTAASKSIEGYADSFIQTYEKIKKEEESFSNSWSVEMESAVLYQTDQLLSLQMQVYSYTGGAHPNHHTYLVNFERASGRIIDYADWFNDPKKLEALVQKGFIKSISGITGEGMGIDEFFWGEGFSLPENYAIGKDSILFLYNPYEAAAYAFGDITVKISNQELSPLLKKSN